MTALLREGVGTQRVAMLLAAVAFVLYLPTFFHGFFADDEIYLAFTNQLLRNSGWADGWRLLFERANPWEFLPLRDLSYWLDFRLYTVEGDGFHASNLAWYALSSWAAGLLIRELVLLLRPEAGARAVMLAWCGVVLFVVHPAHVEAVAWVASRKDLMAGTFSLWSCMVLVRGMRTGALLRAGMLAALLLLMACFSKAAAVVIVLFQTVLLGTMWHRLPQIRARTRLMALAILWLTAILASYVHMRVGAATGIRIENVLPPAEVLERASRILVSLYRLMFLADSLGLYHDVYAIGGWHWPASMAIIGMTAFACFRLRQQPSLWALGLVLCLVPCVVYLQLAPFTTWSLASERFIFVSVAGLSLMLVDVCDRLSERFVQALLLVLVLLCGGLVWQRVGEWAYRDTLFNREYARQPHFHGAIRDQVMFILLPEKRFDEAEVLARQMQRPYAADALLAMIVLVRAQQVKGAGECQALAALREKLQRGYAAIRTEPDVSYNNILNNIRTELKLHYPDGKPCPGG